MICQPASADRPSRRTPVRRGISSVLAMLYLILFGTLAIGFYAATTTAVQISANDKKVTGALLAAESGMDFMRYQLSRVSLASDSGKPTIEDLYEDLHAQMSGSGNLSGKTLVLSGNTIAIPGNDRWINLDGSGHTAFRSVITNWNGDIVVKVDGRHGSGDDAITRTVMMEYYRRPRRIGAFDYAVASKGQVVVSKGKITSVTGVDPLVAAVMSDQQSNHAAITVSGGTIGGELSITEGSGAVVTGGSVAGSSIPSVILDEHVNVVDRPEFPVLDTSAYRQYATNVYDPKKKTQQNIRIPRNSSVKFAGGDTVQGILYIESPNTVEFRGNFNLQGIIVFEDAGSEASNVLDFRGNVGQTPPPSGAQFDALRATTGVSILAPTAKVVMSGSTDSYLRGNVIVGKFEFAGSADIQIDQGTLMTLNDQNGSARFDGKTVKFTGTGSNNQPNTGIVFSHYFEPRQSSYRELSPQELLTPPTTQETTEVQ